MTEDSSQPNQVSANPEFTLGQIVTPIATPSINGAIIQVISGRPENRYVVFLNGRPATYYASQLKAVEVQSDTRNISPLTDFHAYLSALQLRHPGISNLYSLNAARVDYIPYQFKPVMKLIRSDRPRLLIADEVGVGKTIEAGLILRELQARRDINSVLIICPKPLVTERKWQEEMKRFDEHFDHINGETLRFCIDETDKDAAWPDKYSKAILPFSLFNEKILKKLTDLNPPPKFDLVIVDEAHRLRNTETDVHQGVRFFCDNAEAVIFLTATPVQLGSNDLYVLLNVLRPDIIIDHPSFEHRAAPNPYINKAIEIARRAGMEWQKEATEALNEAIETEWGKVILRNDPAFQRLLNLLQDKELSDIERISFIRETEQTHTFASMINRTRRRDIGSFTVRTPETVRVEFTPEQKEIHDRILDIQAKILGRIHGNQYLKFMMTTIRRQVASCLFGLKPFLEDILTRRVNELQWDESDEIPESFSSETVNSIEDEISSIIALVENIDPYDPKLEALFKIVLDKQELPNNKILLFSSFRHTLKYILNNLSRQGMRVGLIQGDIPDEDRRNLRKRFSLPKGDPNAIDILLSSEVGCEGLDYQFCDCMVNYDLPWNPMRVEQRIGRIDRYGQKSEKVVIYNLVTPGTVDADIYERCLERIGVFHNAIGGCEEILGRITAEIHDVAENLSLTEKERKEKLQQIADNDIRLLKEQADLEEKQADLFGLRLPSRQKDTDVESTRSFWLSSKAMQNLTQRYIENKCGRNQEYILGEKPLKTLRLNQDSRNLLLDDLKKLKRKTSPLLREWEKWLKGSDPHIQITFDSACATENRSAIFITPVHPLALQAAHNDNKQQAVYTSIRITDHEIPAGSYPFAIYQWQIHGIREDILLKPVCDNSVIAEKFLSLLEKSTETTLSMTLPDQEVFDNLDSLHHQLWANAREEHQRNNTQLAHYRKESLTSSHNARLNILHEQQSKATNENIRRMKRSELRRAETDFERHIAEIQRAETQADIVTQAVAFGVMVVEGE